MSIASARAGTIIFRSVRSVQATASNCRMTSSSSSGLQQGAADVLEKSKPQGKLIFAPAGSKLNARADQYTKGTLHASQLHPNPLTQFHNWFTAAQSAEQGVYQPETVCLSTASLPSGQPSSRFVYLKELDDRGFVVYSNWGTSKKAEELAKNPRASLAFWWREVERQVRVEGRVERLSTEESSVYYRTRARGSKIGAWASEQSKVLSRPGLEAKIARGEIASDDDDGRAVLEQRVRDIETRFEGVQDDDIECPPFWGGLRVVPEVVEFWQGRESRLHDRFKYTLIEGKGQETEWKIERLSP